MDYLFLRKENNEKNNEYNYLNSNININKRISD